MTNRSHLLINEPPLQILPSLAKAIGLNEAVVLQQLHWWMENPNVGEIRNGVKWIFNTYEEWQENFPFWSVSTIQRIFSNLENLNVVIAAQLDSSRYDRRKFYRIDYRQLAMLEDVNLTRSNTHKVTSSKIPKRGLLDKESEKTPETTPEKKKVRSKNDRTPLLKIPDRAVPLYRKWIELCGHEPTDYAEAMFWIYGRKGTQTHGLDYAAEHNVTPEIFERAFRTCQKASEKNNFPLSKPSTVVPYALSLLNNQTAGANDIEKLKKKKVERRAEVESLQGTTITE